MLTIIVGAQEVFDTDSETFVSKGGMEIQLEHSLVSLSKWESKFEKPFLSDEPKTPDELIYYIRCMILTPNVSDELLSKISDDNVVEINNYFEAKMTATWFSDQPGAPKSREIITSELIYYWMSAFHIDFRCETWNLNRLFTLIRVATLKQAKPKKMSRQEVANRNREINEKRKAQLGSKG